MVPGSRRAFRTYLKPTKFRDTRACKHGDLTVQQPTFFSSEHEWTRSRRRRLVWWPYAHCAHNQYVNMPARNGYIYTPILLYVHRKRTATYILTPRTIFILHDLVELLSPNKIIISPGLPNVFPVVLRTRPSLSASKPLSGPQPTDVTRYFGVPYSS